MSKFVEVEARVNSKKLWESELNLELKKTFSRNCSRNHNCGKKHFQAWDWIAELSLVTLQGPSYELLYVAAGHVTYKNKSEC